MEDQSLDLPPGFRFHPTDEEIITHYLSPKIINHGAFAARAIGEVDLNKCEPWELPGKAKMGEKEWYFFCQRDRKYPTGMRTNRATECGYWKATGKDKEIYRGQKALIGMKKTLVFYRGRAPKGEKTNWVMHEFRLENKLTFTDLPRSSKDEWVVSKVFHKNTGLRKTPQLGDVDSLVRMNSFANELMDSPTLPPLMDPHYLSSGMADSDSFDAKAIMASSAPLNSYYFSAMSDTAAVEGHAQKLTTIPLYNSSSSCNPPPTPSTCYFLPESAMRGRYCKAEQFSGQPMLGLDAGDRNTENSSVISGSCGSYGRDGGGGAMDLANMWRC